LRIWLQDYFKKEPDAPKILSRFFHERETVDLVGLAKHLIKEGVIKPQDVDIRNIVASYSRKVGFSYAWSEVIQKC